MDLEAKTLKELKTETDRLTAAAFKKGIVPEGDKRSRYRYIDFLNRCLRAGLGIFEAAPGDTCNSPAADLNEAASRAIDDLSRNSQSQELVDAGRADTEPEREDDGAGSAALPSGGDGRHGITGYSGRPAIEQQKCGASDRLSMEKKDGTADRQPVLPRQSTELAPQSNDCQIAAPNITPPTPNITPPTPNITPPTPQSNDRQITDAYNEEQRPPARGEGRRKCSLAIGMQVGRRSDRQHVGKIVGIYRTSRGIWRAKIEPLNKPNHTYFDLDNLVEQKLIYDYEMPLGGFVRTGAIFNRKRGESFEVYTRKQPPAPLTNWSLEELRSLSISKLKKLARDMQIYSIPGSACKRSLMRAILAEQAIASEGRQEPIAQQFVLANRKKRQAKTDAIGKQLPLFDLAAG